MHLTYRHGKPDKAEDRPTVEITDEMVEAGLRAFEADCDSRYMGRREMVEIILEAALGVTSTAPPDTK